MNVGFIHGVMNTDNMAISGETIDYGPCAFMEAYDPATVFSSIDRHGRYAFGNQPAIAQWNLARLAEALLPLIADDPDQAATLAMEVLERLPGAVPVVPAARAARQARVASGRTRRCQGRCHWPRIGSRCCRPGGWISRSDGGGWPMQRRATRRRCARSSPKGRRRMRGSPGGGSVARARIAAREGHCDGGCQRADRPCAASIRG